MMVMDAGWWVMRVMMVRDDDGRRRPGKKTWVTLTK